MNCILCSSFYVCSSGVEIQCLAVYVVLISFTSLIEIWKEGIGVLQQHIFCVFEPVVCNFRLLNDAYCEVRVK